MGKEKVSSDPEKVSRSVTLSGVVWGLFVTRESLTLGQLMSLTNASRDSIKAHIKRFRRAGIIERVAYGVWRKKVSSDPGNPPPFIRGTLTLSTRNKGVRVHGVCLKVRVRPNKVWLARRELLVAAGVPIRSLHNRGLCAVYGGLKVHLFRGSILVYGLPDCFGAVASVGLEGALKAGFGVIAWLERLLGTSLKWGPGYRFKVFRGHAGDVNNELAAHALAAGLGAYIGRDPAGKAWLMIDGSASKDGSFIFKELETIAPDSFVSDMDEVVMPWFNGLRAAGPGFTPQFILSVLAKYAELHGEYAININMHTDSIKELNRGVRLWADSVDAHISAHADLIRLLELLVSMVQSHKGGGL